MSKLLRIAFRQTHKYVSKTAIKPKKRINYNNLRSFSSSIFIRNNKLISNNKWNNNNNNKIQLILSNKFSGTTVNVPNMGDSISEGTLVEWSKNVGEQCNVDDVVAIIETDKVSIDVRTDYAGVLTEQLAKIDDTLEVGAPLFIIDQSKTGSAPAAPKTDESPKPSETAPKPTEAKPATPSTPSPPPKTAEAPKTSSSPKTPPPPPPNTGDIIPSGVRTRTKNVVAMSRMRQTVAKRLKEAQNTAACLTTFNEIDMSNIINFRNKYKEEFEKIHGVKLGFMSAFVTASTKALQKFPAVNAYISETGLIIEYYIEIYNIFIYLFLGKEIIYHDYCDISVAVASPSGLVVPVLRNTEAMSFAEIEKQIGFYANKAKSGTLALDDMAGGTFTISNGGVFGSLMGTPILNPPQSAILGMHGTFQRPVADGKDIKIKPMMYIALTYDHRIIDGREAVSDIYALTAGNFCNAFVDAVTNALINPNLTP